MSSYHVALILRVADKVDERSEQERRARRRDERSKEIRQDLQQPTRARGGDDGDTEGDDGDVARARGDARAVPSEDGTHISVEPMMMMMRVERWVKGTRRRWRVVDVSTRVLGRLSRGWERESIVAVAEVVARDDHDDAARRGVSRARPAMNLSIYWNTTRQGTHPTRSRSMT